MARKLTNGTTLAIGSTFGTTATITAISNASPAVATCSVGHGLVVGDWVQILTSGWSRAAARVFRVSAVATNDVTLEGFDTTDTTKYSAGGGAGTLREVTAWTDVTQINADSFATSGGEQNFETGQYLDSDQAFNLRTNKSPVQITIVVDDDQTASFWTTVKAADASGADYPLRLSYPEGGKTVASGTWSYETFARLAGNQVRKRGIFIALSSVPTEYVS